MYVFNLKLNINYFIICKHCIHNYAEFTYYLIKYVIYTKYMQDLHTYYNFCHNNYIQDRFN